MLYRRELNLHLFGAIAVSGCYIRWVAPGLLQGIAVSYRDLDLRVHVSCLLPLLVFLKYHSTLLFKTLVDIVVYDVPGRKKRFVVLYLLLSLVFNTRLIVRTQVDEVSSIVSVVRLFQNANWLEREVWDMFGIFFFQHPDLRRILTDYGFSGHPLRKDFPLTGYVELWYSQFSGRLVHLPVSLVQEFREYTYDLFRGKTFGSRGFANAPLEESDFSLTGWFILSTKLSLAQYRCPKE